MEVLNGTITITVGGGTSPYSYLWSDGSTSQNRTGLVVGTYCVTVSDANSCSAVDCSTISYSSALVPSITFNNITCNGFSDGNIKVSTHWWNKSIYLHMEQWSNY